MLNCQKRVAVKILSLFLFLVAVLWAGPLSAASPDDNASDLFTVQADNDLDEPYSALVIGIDAQPFTVSWGNRVDCRKGPSKREGDDSIQIVVKDSSGDVLAEGRVTLTAGVSWSILPGKKYGVIVELANLACGKSWWLRIRSL